MTKLWAWHLFAARSCCDLDLQSSDPINVRDMSSQYGDHVCKIVLISNFKKTSYGADMILLQAHAVTLTFKVVTKILHVTRRLNMVIISMK